MTVIMVVTRVVAWLRKVNAEITELQQRRRLLSQPWLEEFLHWGLDGTLHGVMSPTSSGGPSSVTESGWCPGMLVGSSLPGRPDDGLPRPPSSGFDALPPGSPPR